MRKNIKSDIFRLFWNIFTPIRLLSQRPAAYSDVCSPKTKLKLPNNKLLPEVRNLIEEGHTVTINVKGYSMRPFLEHNRDSVVLASFEELHVGDVVLAEITRGQFVLHRIIKQDNDRIVLMGDGNIRGTEICRRKDIAAVVRTFIRNGISIDAANKKWNRYGLIWAKLLPVRRYLLWIYKLNLNKS